MGLEIGIKCVKVVIDWEENVGEKIKRWNVMIGWEKNKLLYFGTNVQPGLKKHFEFRFKTPTGLYDL